MVRSVQYCTILVERTTHCPVISTLKVNIDNNIIVINISEWSKAHPYFKLKYSKPVLTRLCKTGTKYFTCTF